MLQNAMMVRVQANNQTARDSVSNKAHENDENLTGHGERRPH